MERWSTWSAGHPHDGSGVDGHQFRQARAPHRAEMRCAEGLPRAGDGAGDARGWDEGERRHEGGGAHYHNRRMIRMLVKRSQVVGVCAFGLASSV